jgi:hypothetical protein
MSLTAKKAVIIMNSLFILGALIWFVLLYGKIRDFDKPVPQQQSPEISSKVSHSVPQQKALPQSTPQADPLTVLERLLTKDDPTGQRMAIEALANTKDPQAVAILVKYIYRESIKENVAHAVVKLKLMNTPEANQELFKLLAPDSRDFLKRSALGAYWMHGNKDDVPVLEKWLKESCQEELREMTLEVIEECKAK